VHDQIDAVNGWDLEATLEIAKSWPNAFLLLLGASGGSVASLMAVVPRFVGGAFGLPWGSLGLILLAVLTTGMVSSIASVAGAPRVPLLPVLKGDR
jgi:hypothetical protein